MFERKGVKDIERQANVSSRGRPTRFEWLVPCGSQCAAQHALALGSPGIALTKPLSGVSAPSKHIVLSPSLPDN